QQWTLLWTAWVEPSALPWRLPNDPITDGKEFVVNVDRAITISGRVVDESGSSIAGAKVSASIPFDVFEGTFLMLPSADARLIRSAFAKFAPNVATTASDGSFEDVKLPSFTSF